MDECYCMKCKRKTENKDEHIVMTKNNRKAIKCKCAICGTTKYKFVKNNI